MKTRFRVLVLGYGEMGHAMETLLQKRHELAIWEKFPQAGFQSAVLEDAAVNADIVLFCLPVNPHREVCEIIAPLINDTCLCISIAKGLDESGKSAAQIFSELFAPQQYTLLYGPMISEEICAGRYAFAQCGCLDQAVFDKAGSLFQGSRLFIKQSDDIPGISWSVILKNVYAMAFGMADELDMGDNMRGFLSYAALHELNRIVMLMGGRPGSPYQLAGLGDLITTATSEDSHHHELGRKLARGETENINGEGVHTLQMVRKHHLFDCDDYPLFKMIESIVKKPVDVAQQVHQYVHIQMDNS